MRTSVGMSFDRVRPGPRVVSNDMVLSLCLAALGQVGWLLLGFSSFFFFAFRIPELVADVARTDEGSVVVPGLVTSVSDTSLNINKVRVRRISFSWESGGTTHRSDSFHTGDPGVMSGGAVDVLVTPGNPETAVIRGMRRTMADRSVAVVVLFSLIGLILAMSGIVSGLRNARLLREGEPAKGKLVGQRATGVRVNHKPVIEYTFSFRTRSGEERTTSVKTSHGRAILDDAEEPLFYDPHNPGRALLLGALPGDPRVDDDGNFTAPSSARLRLVIPLFVILGWAVGFIFFT